MGAHPYLRVLNGRLFAGASASKMLCVSNGKIVEYIASAVTQTYVDDNYIDDDYFS